MPKRSLRTFAKVTRSTCDAPAQTHPEVVRWPEGAERRVDLARQGIPCLLVVDPGSPVPALAEGEDWSYRTADERDVAARLRRLASATGRRVEHVLPILPLNLTVDEHRVASRLMMAVGSLVRAEDLGVEEVAVVIAGIRVALGPLGWTVLDIGDAGFLLERSEPESP